MDTNDHSGKNPLNASSDETNSPESFKQAAEEISRKSQPRLLLDEHPWVVPAKGSTIPRTRGIQLNSGFIFAPHQAAELHFYNKDGVVYQVKKFPTSGDGIVWNTDFELAKGLGYIHFRTVFANYWSGWKSSGEFYAENPIPAPFVRFSPNFLDSPIVISGTGIAGAHVVVLNDRGERIADGYVQSNRTWTVESLVPSTLNALTFQAYQISEGVMSGLTEFVTTYRAKITSPVNSLLLLVKDISFIGTAAPDTQIKVVSDNNHYDVWSSLVTVPLTEVWQMPMTKVPPSGPAAVKAQIKYGTLPHFYSSVVNFNILGAPRITAPAQSSIQDRTFTLTGENGLSGFNSMVKVFLDSERVGSGTVGEAGIWDAVVTLKPGNHSLAVEQIASGKQTERGAPRAFRIRPAKIGDVKVDIIDKSITFSGIGYPGATVVITVPGWSVTLPQPVVAEGGEWEIKAIGAPLGRPLASIVLKVPDNANGWIESLPYTFEINNSLPDVYAVSSTDDYQPTFSGKGFSGATVRLYNPDGSSQVAPEVVVRGGEWLSKASQQWGPTINREVHVKQFLDGHQSPNWVQHPVIIPPLAPTIDEPVDEGLSPTFRGTCWSGAVVEVSFSDDSTTYQAIVIADTWSYRRPTDFVPDTPHAITVTQTVATLTSPSETKSFTVLRPMIKPVITLPSNGSNVGHEVTVEGTGGMKGARMQVRDVVYDKDLSEPQLLNTDGDWEIPLKGLNIRTYGIIARQTDKNRVSSSDRHNFNVVVLPPQITQPTAGGKLPRTGTLKGLGRPGGRVEVWMVGAAEPWLKDIVVRADGEWEREVPLPVGALNIKARQIFEENGKPHQSEFTDAVQYSVVPAAPFVETPVENQLIGQRVVVSGFGVPGDTVTVKLGALHASAAVMADRTWSVKLVLAETGAMHCLEVTAALDEFESEAAQRAVVLGTYLPSIDIPAAGRSVKNPVLFAGQGRAGVGQVVSWYDPDKKWLVNVPVTADGWQGPAAQLLRQGGQWARFGQTLTGGSEGTHSAWIASARFEVEPDTPQKTDL